MSEEAWAQVCEARALLLRAIDATTDSAVRQNLMRALVLLLEVHLACE